MRGRSIRLSIIILFILGISLAALAFRDVNIDLPGFPALQRGGNGPLGLKLGLDLRGGTHLVYQADTGTDMSITFAEDANEQDINQVLEDSGVLSFEVTTSDSRHARIKTSLLDEAARSALQEALEDQVAPIELFEFSETPDPTSDQMEGVLKIINRRVNLSGTEEPIVQRFGDDRIVVQLPGAGGSVTNVEFSEPTSTADLEDLLLRRGFENYTIKAESDAESDRVFRIRTRSMNRGQREDFEVILAVGIGAIDSFRVTGGIEEAKKLIGDTARLEFKERSCTDATCLTFTDADLGLTGDDLDNAYASTSQNTGEWTINIQFDGRGADIFSDLTQRIAGDQTKRIAIFLDDELLLAPVSRAWIPDGRSVITGGVGGFAREEARTISIQLNSGRLPVPLRLIQESDVDALLGSQSLSASLLAGVLGLGLVMVFMIAYYRMAGVVASVALVFYGVVVLAVFKMLPLTLTLPHIGGFLLSIGLAVDANILIFERMKEEIRVGRTLASSMEVGFNRAWPAIRDGNLSTMITCGVLLWFGSRLGGGLINGFALSLLVGVLVSMFTAVVVSRNLLQLLAWVGLSRRIGLFTPEGAQRPSQAGTRTQAPQGGR
ncbi:MAG: protein translocase subunit SecD [Chloroflexi bacterium]|nr:protein translocase subunit SecD [Chloroflexota bacterium]